MAQLATVLEDQRKTEETALITGSEAIAVACKLADVDVITAYPIRPYDTVMQYVSKLVSNGELDCEYIVAEGEHSISNYECSPSGLRIYRCRRRALAIRNCETRVCRRRASVLWQQWCGLDVCHGGSDRYPRIAYSHGRHGRQSRVGRSWRFRCGAQ